MFSIAILLPLIPEWEASTIVTENLKKRGKQSAESAAQTRIAIIEAATECFAQQGYEATSVREIAQAAQLTHGTLRHHFGSKLDIWKAVADTVLEHYQTRLLPTVVAAGQQQDPLHGFKQVVQTFIEVSYSNPLFAKLLMGENHTDNARSAYVKANFLSLHGPIGILFQRAQSQCEPLKQYTNDSFFMALLSLTFFPLILPGVRTLLTEADVSPQQQTQRIMNILFGAVQAGP
ncbi:MAG: TetR/AcrR family transcriptional regulator [Ketobacter sp.]|nr:TetR/AcrR family transcriptional regulator [Ketobacter sp.]